MRSLLVTLFALALIGCWKEKEKDDQPLPPPGVPSGPIGNIPDPVRPLPSSITLQAFESEILTSLTSGLSNSQQQDSAFFSLCDQLNAGTLTDEMRRGVEKGINSISTDINIEQGRWIGENRCLLHVDLSDYNLDNSRWRFLEQYDPLKLESFTDRGLLIKQLTQKRRPWMNATVFLETALTDNVYYGLLGIPEDLPTFLSSFAGCDLQDDFDDEDEDLFFAGLRRSLIARQKNRSIYIHECRDGPFAGTYDTIVENITSAGRNLSINPFPIEARTNNTFQHDAQEFIGTLPNGLQFYALYNSQGVREVCAPNTVVVDNVRPDIDPAICNARSCVSCHAAGFLEGTTDDFIADHVQGNPNFSSDEAEKARFFFGRKDGMKAALRRGNAILANAHEKLSITSGRQDPINVLTDRIRREMDIRQVAGIFFLTVEEFSRRLPQSPAGLLAIGQLLDGGTINFQDLVQIAPILIDDLNLFQDGVGE